MSNKYKGKIIYFNFFNFLENFLKIFLIKKIIYFLLYAFTIKIFNKKLKVQNLIILLLNITVKFAKYLYKKVVNIAKDVIIK